MNTNLVPHAFAALTLGFAAGSSLGRGAGSGGALGPGGGDAFTSWHQLGSVLWNEGAWFVSAYKDNSKCERRLLPRHRFSMFTRKKIFGFLAPNLLGTHTGLPMLLYDQVLSWGNSVVALGVNLGWRWLDVPGTGLVAPGAASDVSPFAGAVITLGLEAGRDVLPAQLRGDPHAEATVHLAANAGLLLSLGLGCLLLTALMAKPLPNSSSSSSNDASSSSGSGGGSISGDDAEPGCRGDEEKDAAAAAFPVGYQGNAHVTVWCVCFLTIALRAMVESW